MKKIYNERFDETYYEDTLDNGLHVILWEKKDFKNSYFVLGTPFGGLDVKQITKDNKVVTFPAGIAHFLEHKMFEAKEQDVMDAFSAMGANVNAFTSYTETAYYFSTSGSPYEPLSLLLDFVQTLDISEKSVEKEKGIIIQELEMYKQMSDVVLMNESLSAIYKEHPLKYDIGGDQDSVTNTTLQQLQDCYSLNYHPARMVLVGVSGQDPQALMKHIKDNQSNKSFPPFNTINRVLCMEDLKITEKEKNIQMDVSLTRVCMAYKLPIVEGAYARNKLEWCYKFLYDYYFTSLNPAYQNLIDQEIINTSFNFEIDLSQDYSVVMFYGESKQPELFEQSIVEILNGMEVLTKEILQQLKHRYFGMHINALNSHKQIALSFLRNYFNGLDFYKAIEVIEQIQSDDLKQVFTHFDVNNYAITKISK